MRRVHPLSYLVATHDPKRPAKLFMRRDLCAGMELESALYDTGFRHGEPIFMQPPPRALRGAPRPRPHKVPLPFVDSSDLLLQFTRQPISDLHSGPIRKIALAENDLEERIFAAWKRFLGICSRNHMSIHEDLHDEVLAGFEDCREMTFKQKGWGAPYDERNAHDGRGWRKVRGKRKTALFLLRLEHLWKGGPGYLGAFGMDGCTTYVWAYRLARDLRPLLEEPGFVVAELELGRIPDAASDMRFCLDWKIEPVLVHRFAAGSAARTRGA